MAEPLQCQHRPQIARGFGARDLKGSQQKGKAMSHAVLAERGILDLEDITALEPGRITTLLGMLACANVDDLYAAIGEGSILLREFEDTLDLVGIGSTSPPAGHLCLLPALGKLTVRESWLTSPN